jgi:hypothetical protein
VTKIEDLVMSFAEGVRAFETASRVRDATREHTQIVEAFKGLTQYGDEGRDALMALFEDPSPKVRSYAATFLLRHCNDEATRVLKDIAKGEGLVAFSAGQALERWKEGEWSLDPAPKKRPGLSKSRKGAKAK